MRPNETCEKGSISKTPELRVSEFACLHLMRPKTASAGGVFAPATLASRPGPAPHVLYWLLRARDKRKSKPMEVAHGESYPGKPTPTQEPGNAEGGPVQKANPPRRRWRTDQWRVAEGGARSR